MLLEVKNLCISHRTRKKTTPLIHNVSFCLNKHECLGVVGESGSGKTLTCAAITGLLDSKNFIMSGEISFNGKNILNMNAEERRDLRGKKICMILQDPATAFNPLLSIGAHIVETMTAHKPMTTQEALTHMAEMLGKLRLENATVIFNKFPHELSGGMLQRIMIALALVLQPDVIIADEPTSAIDYISQQEVLHELIKIKQEFHTALIFISHNLSLVAHVAEHVLVMRQGQIVEQGQTQDIFFHPQHEYTRNLVETRQSILQSFMDIMGGRHAS